MNWVLVVALVWTALSAVAALVIGRAIRLADRPAAAATSVPTARGNFAVEHLPAPG